jgi:hypothetical protein
MVPWNNPTPERKQRGSSGGGMGSLMSSWIQAEKLTQIALMLPAAGFIGWLAGYGLDRWLHQTWIGIAGAVFGIIAGLVGAVRMAIAASSGSAADSGIAKMDKPGENRNDSGQSGKPGGSGTR